MSYPSLFPSFLIYLHFRSQSAHTRFTPPKMLFTQTALSLLSVAAVATALSHDASPVEHAGLEKRACAKVNLTSSQKKEAAALSSSSKALASKSKSLSKASASARSKASSLSSASKKLMSSELALSKKSASLASRAASISSKSSSVNAKSVSVSARLSSVASVLSASASSVSSVAAAQTSAAAAAANSTCYKISSLEVAMTYTAASKAACSTACGANYAVVGLVEVDSPPATCYCIDSDSLSDLTSVSPNLCDAVYGSTDGLYLTGFNA